MNKYGGFWLRFLAALIDIAVIIMGLVPIIYLLALYYVEISTQPTQEEIKPLMKIIIIIFMWLYYAIMQSSSLQATVGKWLVGLKVTDLENNRISFLRATGRFIVKNLTGFLFGILYIVIAFTKRKQAIHDMFPGTLVIETESPLEKLF